ncbi:F-box and JmjC domain protein, putative [Metarhizium acridum CQMa 102]|uniref:F-box and JmjC domain protein, putative n=1 Tax=Metarhizium acridum (strain CQMa 102) TaxID=655827 RepID=E9DTS7_METAQ|nr:F-box and JmjC domain protein, putative [Metarhizium acridum CQMa 102]EFY92787.1 F-box and JmjC domain protein, putative [Metarhizium acridum CQMa 102]
MPSAVLHHQGNGIVHRSHEYESAESTSFDDNAVTQGDSIPTHPLGVKPLGNRYLSDGSNAKANSGIWSFLPDEMLMLVLEQVDAKSLLRLGSTCKFLFAFCHADELWKALFLQPFACSNIDLSNFVKNIPKANQIRRMENLTYEQYAERWTEKPFILTKCIQDWPVCSKWTIDELLRAYASVEFRAEAVDWTMERYSNYMRDNNDESPLYLFDRKFAEKMGITVGHQDGTAYWKPDCFGPDLFEVLGNERPAHRWLIIGPERSGSTFHKDPNGTSAWNAVIQGSKYWIMFPPAAQVPGVYVSEDSSEVTSPLSIAEWLLTFHEEARRLPECVEGICRTGEILHVPSGWWHLVVNLESGIALTQNFVPQSPSLSLLSEVLLFMRDKADQVSGFERSVEKPFELFTERLAQQYPDILKKALELADKKSGKKRKWDAAIGKETEGDGSGGGFSFGFGGGDDDDEIP